MTAQIQDLITRLKATLSPPYDAKYVETQLVISHLGDDQLATEQAALDALLARENADEIVDRITQQTAKRDAAHARLDGWVATAERLLATTDAPVTS